MEILCEDSGIDSADKNGFRKLRDLLIEKANALNPSECLEKLIGELKENVEEDGQKWDKFVGKYAKGEECCSFDSYWNHNSNVMSEIILAKIPTTKPWELAAWIPMGGFNDCPMPDVQVAVMKYWFEKISGDSVHCYI